MANPEAGASGLAKVTPAPTGSLMQTRDLDQARLDRANQRPAQAFYVARAVAIAQGLLASNTYGRRQEQVTYCCIVRGQSNEFEMPGEDPSAFPDIPSFTEEKYHEFTASILREMIHRTIFAAATAEHSKFGATTGVLWELEGDQATLVATDGRRLALSKGEAKAFGGHSTSGQTPVVPAKAMNLLERSISDPDETIRVSFRPNEVLMKTEKAMVYSRLVEGRFPNYRQALPQKLPIKVPITVGPFMAAVRQAAIMTDDESKRVIFGFNKKKLTLRAQGSESGRSRVELPLEFDGKAIEISFDPKFVLDMLKVLEPDTALTLELNDPGTPGLFRLDPNYLYVVVPLASGPA